MGRVPLEYQTKSGPPPLEIAILRIAEAQHGVVSLEQLGALGLGPSGVRHRVAVGRLHRAHRGVYSVGGSPLAAEGRWMAGVLACGAGAVLSHRSAAELWDLLAFGRRPVDVSVRRAGRRPRAGIEVHRPRRLDRADVTVLNGIPCTTVARTLLDLAGVVNRRRVQGALERAEILRLYDGRAIEDVLARNPTRRGARSLGAAVRDLSSIEPMTRNELERRFLALCSPLASRARR